MPIKREVFDVILIAVLAMTFATSCATIGAGSFCMIAEPILMSVDDELTTETARAILAHNRTGAELCDW